MQAYNEFGEPLTYTEELSLLDKYKFVRLSTYAKEKGINERTLYRQVEEGKVAWMGFDGVKFIISALN